MICAGTIDICVIRGDLYEGAAALTTSWPEVIANPSGYVANMVFREAQDDSLTPYLTLTATPEAQDDATFPVLISFSATAAQTQSLPDWNHVYYVELKEVGGDPVRLYQGKVRIND